MHPSLQGYGTYTYKCDKPDCWYCEMFKIEKPIHREYTMVFKPKKIQKEYRWTNVEIALLRENIDLSINELMPLFKRSKSSILIKKFRLRKMQNKNEHYIDPDFYF